MTRDGVPVTLGSRALDILIALVKNAGSVLDKHELMDLVWPNVTVEEANLRVHLTSLRKALGDGVGGNRFIANVPGRGYVFVAAVEAGNRPVAPVAVRTVSAAAPKMPPLLARMVGRDEAIAVIVELLRTKRFVSIVGPGGMGKTTVAVAIVHNLIGEFDGETYFVDLSQHSDTAAVTAAVAASVGCIATGDDPVALLAFYLKDRRALLVLDNCEHVIETISALAERLFLDAQSLHLLTTTREALRVEGENIHLLAPLESPPEGGALSAVDVAASPAVQLFMDRAAASGHRDLLNDLDAPIIASICRRLDGMPLAIELAAGRVGVSGVRGTADLLDKRFNLLWQGRRSAMPRHQTLRALLDWSFNLLTPYKQAVLSQLSIFIGDFTFEDAVAVICERPADIDEVTDAISSMISKSLISTSVSSGELYCRLLDTTRTYAAVKLTESGEEDAVSRRHAVRFRALLQRQQAGADKALVAARLTRSLGDVRTALEWCFSNSGDRELGIDLAIAAAPLFLHLSLLGECERWCERALSELPAAERSSAKELALQEALAIAMMFTRGNSESVFRAIERAMQLAQLLGDIQRTVQLLAGMSVFRMRTGDFKGALDCANRLVAIAAEAEDDSGTIMGEWMLGASFHLVGDQAAAQRHCVRGFELASASGDAPVDGFGYDHRNRALVALARVLWLRGFPEQAKKTALQAIDEAMRRNHPVTVCIAHIYTIPVWLWSGDFSGAEILIDRVVEYAAKHSLRPYQTVGLALRGESLVLRGEWIAGVELLRNTRAILNQERHHTLATVCGRALAEGLARMGEVNEALATIDSVIHLARTRNGAFDLPDLLRARALVLIASGAKPDLVEACLREAIECASEQSAPGWELRAALPLADLWATRGERGPAQQLIAELYGRFTEGFDTADLMTARRFLEQQPEGLGNVPRQV
ncbi:MAG: helix-turn-helix transcriptional regulator [Beijerinckiaceae bacterium]|nr:helix-turn-helix transcriptional regulator [Beijerinckiaceae bacterium]